jgi:hypothetical protein
MTDTKEEAFDLLEKHRADFLAQARAFLSGHEIGHQLTIDDVRDAVPPPNDIDPRVMGAVFHGQPWKSVGYRRSRRKTCHKRPITIFERIA